MSRNWRDAAGAGFATEKRPATGSLGMVVTNNPLGSAAGVEALAAGGNAIDAAVAALFALTVVEPMMVGIFGAGMSTIRLANGERHCISNYATAPAAATPDMYRPIADDWPDYQIVENRANDVGVLAVGVPGTLLGWCEMLGRFGRLSLADVIQPALNHARRGFLATRYLHEITSSVAADLMRFPETARTFLPDGKPLAPGARVVQSDYAETLALIAAKGPDVLYRGELGARAAACIQGAGGLLDAADLASYHTHHSDVVHGSYRDYGISGPALPSAGGVHLLQMLKLLEPYDVAGLGFGQPEGVHLLAEVMKLAFEDRRRYTGDPAFMSVPVEMLISPTYADERRRLINPQRARSVDTAFHESGHTTHVTTADAHGNVVAATHTIHSAFGSKVTVPGTGMLLNNTMNIFDPHPGLPNSIEPGKRMTSSMAPTIVERSGLPVYALGSVGGTRIFPSVLQAIVNLIDHGMTPQEAVEAPRIWTLGAELALEEALFGACAPALKRLGHPVTSERVIGAGMGLIAFDHDAGTLTGASCWRADGTPLGIGGGMARAGMRFG